MRLHDKSPSHYIQALAGAIHQDPSSLDSWWCLQLRATKDVFIDLPTIIEVRENNKNLGCDIVRCLDNDLLLISQELSEEALHCIAYALTEHMEEGDIEMTLYHLFRDWRKVRNLLLSKCPNMPELSAEIVEAEAFTDLDYMREGFAEMKASRRLRFPQHVMIVEDDPLTRRLLTNAFRNDYALITAETAHAAVTEYLIYAPDIVFLDIGLPDASGFSVLQKLVAIDPDAYIVIFSGNSYLDNVTKALNNGASGFIAKPFQRTRLMHYIEDSVLHHGKACG